MTLREILGLTLVVVALILVPVAWAFSRLLWLFAFTLFVLGIALFYTERMVRRELERDEAANMRPGKGMGVPTDIHNYTGWASGGRSEMMDSTCGARDVDGDC